MTVPVSISLFALSQTGKLRPKKSDTPRMKIFLEEVRSTNCRFESPTAVTIPKIVGQSHNNSGKIIFSPAFHVTPY